MKRETIFLSGIFINMKLKEVCISTDKNAYSPDNSHPNKEFSARVAPLFSKFIIDVIESGS